MAKQPPAWAIELIKKVDLIAADVSILKQEVFEIKQRLDVIEDKLDRNNIK